MKKGPCGGNSGLNMGASGITVFRNNCRKHKHYESPHNQHQKMQKKKKKTHRTSTQHTSTILFSFFIKYTIKEPSNGASIILTNNFNKNPVKCGAVKPKPRINFNEFTSEK